MARPLANSVLRLPGTLDSSRLAVATNVLQAFQRLAAPLLLLVVCCGSRKQFSLKERETGRRKGAGVGVGVGAGHLDGKVHRISDNKSWMVLAKLNADASISIHCATCICFMIWGLSLTFGLTLFMITVCYARGVGATSTSTSTSTQAQPHPDSLSSLSAFCLSIWPSCWPKAAGGFSVLSLFLTFFLGRKWVSNVFLFHLLAPFSWLLGRECGEASS